MKPPMGKVHNTSRFGSIPYPASYGKPGKFSFLVNENNIIFRRSKDVSRAHEMPDQPDLTGSRVRYDQAPPTPLRKIEDAASELPRTTVTAQLLEKHVPGKNLIWCATVQLAWDELGALMKAPLELRGSPPMAVGLNRKLV